MTHAAVPLLSMLLAATASSATPGAEPPAVAPAMTGFPASAAADQQALERRFDAALDPADLREWMQHMAAEPNHVGAPHNRENAEYMRDLFRQWGWDAEIETFDVLYPTPKQLALEMVAPVQFKAALTEPPVAGDASSERKDALPPYNVYGADGDVTAELVYVNYGMPDDYKELARRGIDVKGKIVIARYGSGWRGLKPKLAFEHGAVGCLIYSDPQRRRLRRGERLSRGRLAAVRGRAARLGRGHAAPFRRSPHAGRRRDAGREAVAARRGEDRPQDPGDADLVRRCAAAARGARRTGRAGGLARRAAHHLPHRPRARARVHLKIASDWRLKHALQRDREDPGGESPDEWIVRGNHHDGWVFGARGPAVRPRRARWRRRRRSARC